MYLSISKKLVCKLSYKLRYSKLDNFKLGPKTLPSIYSKITIDDKLSHISVQLIIIIIIKTNISKKRTSFLRV